MTVKFRVSVALSATGSPTPGTLIVSKELAPPPPALSEAQAQPPPSVYLRISLSAQPLSRVSPPARISRPELEEVAPAPPEVVSVKAISLALTAIAPLELATSKASPLTAMPAPAKATSLRSKLRLSDPESPVMLRLLPTTTKLSVSAEESAVGSEPAGALMVVKELLGGTVSMVRPSTWADNWLS